MAVALTLARTTSYVLERERGMAASDQVVTRFDLRALTWAARTRASNAMARGETGTWATECLAGGLYGWHDFSDSDGRKVAFLAGQVDGVLAAPESLDRLATEDGRELARAIWELSSLNATEKKRSVSPPGSRSAGSSTTAEPAPCEPATRTASSGRQGQEDGSSGPVEP